MVLFMYYKDHSEEEWKRIIVKTGSYYCCPEVMVSLTMEASIKKEKEIKKMKFGEWRKP